MLSDQKDLTLTQNYGANSAADVKSGLIDTAKQFAAVMGTKGATPAMWNETQAALKQLGISFDPSGSYTQEVWAAKRNQLLSQLDAISTKGALSSTTKEADKSLYDQATSNQQTANANARANITAGIDRSKAGLLGAYNANESNTQIANNLTASRLGTNAATQADYLQKMSNADALDIQAENIRKGAGLATASAALQGAAAGMSSGAALAGASDERVKESPEESDDLLEMVKQFRSLYRKLQTIKQQKEGGKQ